MSHAAGELIGFSALAVVLFLSGVMLVRIGRRCGDPGILSAAYGLIAVGCFSVVMAVSAVPSIIWPRGPVTAEERVKRNSW